MRIRNSVTWLGFGFSCAFRGRFGFGLVCFWRNTIPVPYHRIYRIPWVRYSQGFRGGTASKCR